MTGFGSGGHRNEQLSIAVEVRSVNNRYLKITTRSPDAYAVLEGEIEKVVRQVIARGTVSIAIRIDRMEAAAGYVVNEPVLSEYWRQLHAAAERIHLAAPTDLGKLLDLPGVISETSHTAEDVTTDWPSIRETLTEALGRLNDFRLAEGRSMEQDLKANCEVLSDQLEAIASRAPQVVADYRDRLLDRVSRLLEASEATVGHADLIREVSIFSERCDINEELTRLRSHLDQFQSFLEQDRSMGRKLDFLTQEMFREVNTIGSKANNVEIAHAVVEMKAAIEKMREILQNVE